MPHLRTYILQHPREVCLILPADFRESKFLDAVRRMCSQYCVVHFESYTKSCRT